MLIALLAIMHFYFYFILIFIILIDKYTYRITAVVKVETVKTDVIFVQYHHTVFDITLMTDKFQYHAQFFYTEYMHTCQ